MTCGCGRLVLAVFSLQEMCYLSQYTPAIQAGLAQTFTPGSMLDKGIGQADIEYGDRDPGGQQSLVDTTACPSRNRIFFDRHQAGVIMSGGQDGFAVQRFDKTHVD